MNAKLFLKSTENEAEKRINVYLCTARSTCAEWIHWVPLCVFVNERRRHGILTRLKLFICTLLCFALFLRIFLMWDFSSALVFVHTHFSLFRNLFHFSCTLRIAASAKRLSHDHFVLHVAWTIMWTVSSALYLFLSRYLTNPASAVARREEEE